MAEVKLYYFDGRGIGEPIRWILSYGGIKFEDFRVPYNAFPPTLPTDIKASMHKKVSLNIYLILNLQY